LRSAWTSSGKILFNERNVFHADQPEPLGNRGVHELYADAVADRAGRVYVTYGRRDTACLETTKTGKVYCETEATAVPALSGRVLVAGPVREFVILTFDGADCNIFAELKSRRAKR